MISIKKDFDKIPKILLSGQEDAWQDESVLIELKQLYNNKCAYCEQKNEFIEIDHYRPQKKYPWLKNEWSNLLPICSTCNKAKRDSFPIEGKQHSSPPENKLDYRADSKFLLSEKPLIIHPEVDMAENHFYFEKNGIVQGYTKKGRITISTINLYRETLTKQRYEIYTKCFEQLKEIIIGKGKDSKDFYQKFIKSLSKKEEFAAFKKQIYYQFEEFLYKEVLADIETNKYKIFKEDYSKYPSEEAEEIDFYGQSAEYELSQYYKTIFDTEYYYNQVKDLEMPLSIVGFSVSKFQGIKHLSVDNIPLNTQWIFFTGENGFGKTSILKALLLGLIGKSEFKESEIDENTRIKLKIIERKYKHFSIQDHDKVIHNIFDSYIFSEYKENIAAYGSKRTDFVSDASNIPISDNIFERTNKVLNTEHLLKTLDGNTELNAFKTKIIEVFFALIPKLSKIEFVANDNGTSKEALYFEKDEDNNDLPPVTFNQLAMGMRSIVGLVGDIIQRLSKNKDFQEKKKEIGLFQTTSYNILDIAKEPFHSLSELCGIVIIDEFDNHLHPSWQRMLVKKLTELFPKVQFIVSTHSPISLLGAPPDRTVIFNVNRTQKEGITVQRLEKIEKELPNLLPNTLLTSPVFGLSSIKSEYNKNIDDLNVDDHYDDQEKYDRIDREIDAFFKKRN